MKVAHSPEKARLTGVRRLECFADERGYILGLVMMFFFVFSLMGLAFTEMGRYELMAGRNHYDKVRAFYNAEAGIHKALWLANKVSKASATFSDATVTVTYDTVGQKIKAIGQAGSVKDSLQVSVESSGGGTSGGWEYVLYTDTEDLRLDEGSGTITGDVHSNEDVDKDSDYTVNGTITEGTPNVPIPTIDWNFLKTAAQNAGQYVTSSLVFNAAGSPYTGVWYTTSSADIEENAIINGTVVAEGKIEFKGDDATITATPSNYPALVCQDDIEGNDYEDITVTGLMYTDTHFDKDLDDFTLIGAVICGEDLHHSSSNFVATYNATYTTNVQGTNIGGSTGSATITVTKWEDL